MEEWKPIKGFEGLYEISSIGRVKSLSRLIDRGGKPNYVRKERMLMTPLDRYGYKKVSLSKNKVRKHTTVHRLVAEAFISNPKELPEVNHKDGDKLNNHKNNLEWCTGEYNMKHARSNNLIDYNKVSGENCYITNLTNEVVSEIREKLNKGIRNKDIEVEYKLSRSAVSRIKLKQSFKNI